MSPKRRGRRRHCENGRAASRERCPCCRCSHTAHNHLPAAALSHGEPLTGAARSDLSGLFSCGIPVGRAGEGEGRPPGPHTTGPGTSGRGSLSSYQCEVLMAAFSWLADRGVGGRQHQKVHGPKWDGRCGSGAGSMRADALTLWPSSPVANGRRPPAAREVWPSSKQHSGRVAGGLEWEHGGCHLHRRCDTRSLWREPARWLSLHLSRLFKCLNHHCTE